MEKSYLEGGAEKVVEENFVDGAGLRPLFQYGENKTHKERKSKLYTRGVRGSN